MPSLLRVVKFRSIISLLIFWDKIISSRMYWEYASWVFLCKIVWLWVCECDTTLGSFNTFNIDLFDRILQMVCPSPRLITLATLLSHNHRTITSHSLIPSAFPSVHKIFQHFILMSMSRDGLQNTPDKKATIKSLYKELPPFLVGDTLQIVK